MIVHHKEKSRKQSKTHAHAHAPPQRRKNILFDAYEQLKAGKPVAAGHAEHLEHGGPLVSTREVEYNGHKIAIRTTYEIKVDGKLLSGHVFVDNSGRVYSHAMPTYSFPSTVDLVKSLIDTFPDSFHKVSRHALKRKKRGR